MSFINFILVYQFGEPITQSMPTFTWKFGVPMPDGKYAHVCVYSTGLEVTSTKNSLLRQCLATLMRADSVITISLEGSLQMKVKANVLPTDIVFECMTDFLNAFEKATGVLVAENPKTPSIPTGSFPIRATELAPVPVPSHVAAKPVTPFPLPPQIMGQRLDGTLVLKDREGQRQRQQLPPPYDPVAGFVWQQKQKGVRIPPTLQGQSTYIEGCTYYTQQQQQPMSLNPQAQPFYYN